MTLSVFPTLKGLSWSSFKRPTLSTRVATHVSGREVRAANWAYPLWEFELVYDLLTDASLTDDLRTIAGFFLSAQGQFGTWLYADPADCTVSGQVIAIGDGVTTSFTALRGFGAWVEPVGQINAVSAVTVGGAATSAYSVAGNTISFTTAPAAGAAVAWTGTYYFVCRFLDDQHEYENFMSNLWTLKSCKFRSVKP